MASVDQLLPVGAAPVADEKAKDPEKGMRALSVVGPPTESQESASLMDRIEAFLPGNTRMKKWITVGLVLAIALVASVLGWRMYASKSKGHCPDGYVEVEPSAGRRLMDDKNCVKEDKTASKRLPVRANQSLAGIYKQSADFEALSRTSNAQALMTTNKRSTWQTTDSKVPRGRSTAQVRSRESTPGFNKALVNMNEGSRLQTPNFKVQQRRPSHVEVGNSMQTFGFNEADSRFSTPGFVDKAGSSFSTPGFVDKVRRPSSNAQASQVRRPSSNLQDRRQSSNLQELVGKYNDKRHGFTSTEAVVHQAEETMGESVAYDALRRTRQGHYQFVYDLKNDNQDLKKQKAFNDLTVYVQQETLRLSNGLKDSILLGNIRDIDATIADTDKKCSVTNSNLHKLSDKMQVKAYAEQLKTIDTSNKQLAMKIEQKKADLNSKKSTLNNAFKGAEAQIRNLEGSNKPYEEVVPSLQLVQTDYDNFVRTFETKFQIFLHELNTLIREVLELNSKQIAVDWSMRMKLKREVSSQKD